MPSHKTAMDPHPEHKTADGCGLWSALVGNIPWEGDPAVGFCYKMFKFGKNEGGKKAEWAILSHGPKSWSCPKG